MIFLDNVRDIRDVNTLRPGSASSAMVLGCPTRLPTEGGTTIVDLPPSFAAAAAAAVRASITALKAVISTGGLGYDPSLGLPDPSLGLPDLWPLSYSTALNCRPFVSGPSHINTIAMTFEMPMSQAIAIFKATPRSFSLPINAGVKEPMAAPAW